MSADGCWWSARVTRLGVPGRRDLVWPRRLGPALAEALINVPVRCCPAPGGFVHPAPLRDRDPLDLEFFVGVVDHAWPTRDSVLATLRLALDGRAVALGRGLLALERDGRLARIGLSIVGQLDSIPYVSGRRSVRYVSAIRGVLAVDLVTAPASPGSALLRSTIPTPERSFA